MPIIIIIIMKMPIVLLKVNSKSERDSSLSTNQIYFNVLIE